MKARLVLLILTICSAACSPAKDSQEETAAPPRPIAPIDPSGDNNFKYGETQTSASGWTVTYDSADPVEQVTTAEGWTIEVKHE